MEKLMKSIIKSSFISSSILVILGLLLFIRSDDTIVAISYLVGGTTIVLGILAFIKFIRNSDKNVATSVDIVYGVITIVFGIFILSHPKLVATVIPIIIGTWVLIKSTLKIAYALELKGVDSPVWKSTLVTSIISALVGVAMIFNPFKTSVIVFKIIGVAICIYAIMDIISTIQLKKNVEYFNEQNDEVVNSNVITTQEEIVEASIEEIDGKVNENIEPDKSSDNRKKKKRNKSKNKRKKEESE